MLRTGNSSQTRSSNRPIFSRPRLLGAFVRALAIFASEAVSHSSAFLVSSNILHRLTPDFTINDPVHPAR